MGMIIALKITAASIADSGLFNPIIFKDCNAGIEAMNNAGTIAKYFATSFAIETVSYTHLTLPTSDLV